MHDRLFRIAHLRLRDLGLVSRLGRPDGQLCQVHFELKQIGSVRREHLHE